MIVCAVRSSPRWRRGEIDLPEGRSLARLWDRTFRTGYLDFRAALREIADEARRNMDPAFDRVLHHPSDELDRLLREPGHLVLPTDEDDWFHPNAIAMLGEARGIVRWNYLELRNGRTATRLEGDGDWGRYFLWQSNNLALHTPVRPDSLRSHAPDRREDTFLPLFLSAHSKTPASLSWRWRPTARTLLGDVLDPPELLPAPGPFHAPAAKVEALVKDLRPTRLL